MKVLFSSWFPIYPAKMICLGNKSYYRISKELRPGLIANPGRIKRNVQHERTHQLQQKELLYVFFPILYIFEWVFKIFTGKPYWNLSFEREARHCQKDPDNYEYENIESNGKIKGINYIPKNEQGSLINRKHYSWTKYIFHDVEEK